MSQGADGRAHPPTYGVVSIVVRPCDGRGPRSLNNLEDKWLLNLSEELGSSAQ